MRNFKAYPATLTGLLMTTNQKKHEIMPPYPKKLRYILHHILWMVTHREFGQFCWSAQKMGAVLVKEGILKPVMKKGVIDHWEGQPLTAETLEKVLLAYDYETLERKITAQDETLGQSQTSR